MSEYFPKTKSVGTNVKVELDLSNYATKVDLKNTTGVDTSGFAKKKTDLANLKSDVDKLDTDKLKKVPSNLSNLKSNFDIEKLETTPVDLGEVSDEVKNDVVKKTEYDELIKRLMLFRLMMLVIWSKLTITQKLMK